VNEINHAEYPKKLKRLDEDSLRYIMKDAHEAMTANPEGPKAGYYADEINYCADELARRKEKLKCL
jgi:hypothetical protein